MNLKLQSRSDILKDVKHTISVIDSCISSKRLYLDRHFEEDAKRVVEAFYNSTELDDKEREIVTERLVDFLNFFHVDTVIRHVAEALQLGFRHHVEHVTTSIMCEELGISKQAIKRYTYDIHNDQDVQKAKRVNHPMIPVQQYVRIVVMAERSDFDIFKKWFLNRKKR